MNASVSKLLAAGLMAFALCAIPLVAQPAAVAETETLEEPQRVTPVDAGEDVPSRADRDEEGDEEPKTEAPARKKIAVERIAVTLNRQVLLPGGQAKAQLAFYPKGAGQVPVSWSSSAPQAVSVDEDGLVTALTGARVPDEGMDVDIWARATDGSLAMNCATVKVMPQVRSLTMLEKEIALSVDKDNFSGVAVEIAPASLLGVAEVEWVSADPAVATVSASGAGEVALVYAAKPGQTTITARAKDGSGCSDTLTVVVY